MPNNCHTHPHTPTNVDILDKTGIDLFSQLFINQTVVILGSGVAQTFKIEEQISTAARSHLNGKNIFIINFSLICHSLHYFRHMGMDFMHQFQHELLYSFSYECKNHLATKSTNSSSSKMSEMKVIFNALQISLILSSSFFLCMIIFTVFYNMLFFVVEMLNIHIQKSDSQTAEGMINRVFIIMFQWQKRI